MNSADRACAEADRNPTTLNRRSARGYVAAMAGLLILFTSPALASNGEQPSAHKGAGFSIDRFSIDGGVGYASGGAYSVSGTAGQADADSLGPASGGVYSVTGGIWPGSTAPEQPDALHADGFE